MVVLLEGSMDLCQCDHRVLGPLPVSPIAQFGRAASSRKSLGGSKLLPFNNVGHGVLGDLQMLQMFFGTLTQICASKQSCLGALRTVPSTSWLGYCSDMH